MNTDKNELERKQYNRKLLKESFNDEMKKPHRIDWVELAATAIGTFLGLLIKDAIGTKELISNSFARFCADVAITIVMILVVQGIFFLIRKALHKKQS